VPVALEPRAIATLEDVVAFGYDPADDEGAVDLWIDCLNAAAQEFHRYARREFVAKNAVRDAENDNVVTVASETRLFDLDHDVVCERKLYVGDMAEQPSAVRIYGYQGELIETVSLAAVRYEPLNREPWEPIEEINFLPWRATSTYQLMTGYYVEVDSRWGFPELPANLVRACANPAAVWFARDIRHFSTTFKLDELRHERPRAIAPAIKESVGRYRRLYGG
jgi:hypothetical protein